MALRNPRKNGRAQLNLTRLLKDPGWRVGTHRTCALPIPNLTRVSKDAGISLGAQGKSGHTTQSGDAPERSRMAHGNLWHMCSQYRIWLGARKDSGWPSRNRKVRDTTVSDEALRGFGRASSLWEALLDFRRRCHARASVTSDARGPEDLGIAWRPHEGAPKRARKKKEKNKTTDSP